jgi:hypothetical protein
MKCSNETLCACTWQQDHAKAVEMDPAYRNVLYSFAALHFAALLNSCYIAGTYNLHPLALTGELSCHPGSGVAKRPHLTMTVAKRACCALPQG